MDRADCDSCCESKRELFGVEDWSETDIAGIDFRSSGTEADGSEEVIREISYV